MRAIVAAAARCAAELPDGGRRPGSAVDVGSGDVGPEDVGGSDGI